MNTKVLINHDGQTCFKVLQTESYTIPDVVAVSSPTGRSSGVSPVTTFDSRRAAVGGELFCAFSDVAGPTSDLLGIVVKPGDVIACSAVIGGIITVTLTPFGGTAETIALISAAAVGGVVGYWA